MKPLDDAVTVICYNSEKLWEKRSEAIAHYEEGIFHSEGSEQQRYYRILDQLRQGSKVCVDE